MTDSSLKDSLIARISILQRIQQVITRDNAFTETERFEIKYELDATEAELARLSEFERYEDANSQVNREVLESRERTLNTLFQDADATEHEDIMGIFLPEHARLNGKPYEES